MGENIRRWIDTSGIVLLLVLSISLIVLIVRLDVTHHELEDAHNLNSEYLEMMEENSKKIERYKKSLIEMKSNQENIISDYEKQVRDLEGQIIDLNEANEILRQKVKKLENEKNVSRSSSPSVFDDGNIMKIVMTHYTAKCKGCIGITKTGFNVKNTTTYNGINIVAVDTNLIPLGSIIAIADGNRQIKAIALDTGGKIKGHRIDFLVSSNSEAFSKGKKVVYVKVLRRGW